MAFLSTGARPGSDRRNTFGLHGRICGDTSLWIAAGDCRSRCAADRSGEQRAPLLELGVRGGALHRKYKIYLDYVGVAKVPEDCEDRLTEMFPGAYQRLRICALDPYDLALSKLERNIQRDRDDVKHLAQFIPLNLKILAERYQKELRWQLGNPQREDLTLKLWTEMIKETSGGTAGRVKA
jgi:Nucleotidyltransferase of unknown function (DUF6036)